MKTHLALMGQLEASLLGSRKALLALDLAGIERGTREQIVLAAEMAALLRRDFAPSAQQSPLVEHLAEHSSEAGSLSLPGGATGLQEELRKSESRVLRAARLQAALLVRARGKLRVLANVLAGPSIDYGPLLERKGALARGFGARGWKRAGGI